MIPNDSVSTLNLTIVVVAVVINDSVCSNYSFTAYVYGLDIMNCLLKMMWKYLYLVPQNLQSILRIMMMPGA